MGLRPAEKPREPEYLEALLHAAEVKSTRLQATVRALQRALVECERINEINYKRWQEAGGRYRDERERRFAAEGEVARLRAQPVAQAVRKLMEPTPAAAGALKRAGIEP